MVASHDALSERYTIELLTVVAHYHFTEAALDTGHVVNFGRPWMPGSPCTRGLVCLPYLDGPKLEKFEDDGVRILWLLPITESERVLALEQGLDALEHAFQVNSLKYWNPFRSPVV